MTVWGLWGCGGAHEAPQTSTPEPAAITFEPSPLLALARSEREVPPVRPQWFRRRFGRHDEAPPSDGSEGMRRDIRIHPFRLATPEALARASLRDAESRRPRELTPTRMLVRARRVIAPSGADRRHTRRWLDDRDGALTRCLVTDQITRPEVLLGAPVALVLENAMASGTVVYGVDVTFDARGVPTVQVDPPVEEEVVSCLQAALTAPDAPRLASSRITAFAHAAEDFNGGMHRALANEAATLGWVALERGAADEALSYFDDAYWLYHRPEYALLQAMALEQLGRPNAARRRYETFVEARPHAPETEGLRTKLARMDGPQL